MNRKFQRQRKILSSGPGLRATMLSVAACLGLTALGPASATAQHPNHPQGFSPERLYQENLDQVDQVDLFSGTLSMTLPVGPFRLSYNSNIWRYEVVEDGGQSHIVSFPDRRTTGGLGWHLGLGEVYSPSHPYNQTDRWLYVDRDGGRHLFYDRLHRDDAGTEAGTFYSRDDSYLRLRRSNNFWLEIDFPDGTTQRFNSGTGGLNTVYRLEKIWSPFASELSPDVTITYSEQGAEQTRTMVDRYGRTHRIMLRTDLPWIDAVVTRVEAETVGGGVNVYTFDYDTVPVNVSCKQTDPAAPNRISVPHLARLNLPDGTSYAMKENGQLLYHNLCQSGIDDLPGSLRGLILPTGGKIAWTWQEYEFPPGDNSNPFNTSAGVASRRLIDPSGQSLGGWTYRTTNLGVDGKNDPEMRTEVVYPTGDCSKHYFNARYTTSPQNGWEYGLPFSYRSSEGGVFLSSETYTDHTAGGACGGTKLRSNYLRFRHDRLPGSNNRPASEWYNSNRTVEAFRTVFHDDGNRWRQEEYSDFDGLGNFRVTEQSNNFFADPSRVETRLRVVSFNKVPGNYPGSFTPIPSSEPWVLSVFESAQVSEPQAEGSRVAKIEYDFDRDTGVARCQRRLTVGTQRSTADLVSRSHRNALGLVESVERWGGDMDPVSVSGSGCGDTPTVPSQKAEHTYQSGVLVATRPILPSGLPAANKTFDVDIDPASGRVTRRRMASGRKIDYTYDALGRVQETTSSGSGTTVYEYLPASGQRGPEVKTTQYSGDSSSQVVFESTRSYDPFGRLKTTARRLPDGTWSKQTVERNARGWVTAVSEWGPDGTSVTQFLDHDPFGRPGTIVPADGAGREVLISYQGERRVTRQAKVAVMGGETYVSRVEALDSAGRLRSLWEPSGANGAMVPTHYSYDVNGNMTKMVSGTSPAQVRTWTFNNLGFLLAQTLPEKGVAGNGSVTYADFDSRGKPHRMIDGSNHLVYAYDDLGRLLTVRDANQGNRLVSEFFYDGAPGSGAGKLWYSVHHNWVDLPWNAQGVEDVTVRESFEYRAVGGDMSHRKTRYQWGARSFEFEQVYDHDSRGQLTRLDYPACKQPECGRGPASQGRTINYQYAGGKMTGVSGWLQLEYNPSGTWSRLTHADGSVDVHLPDPDFSRRPRRLGTLAADGTSVLFDTGLMTYDGAGNLKSAGDDIYRYDRAGRLKMSRLTPLFGGPAVRQSFTYDQHGNITSKTTTRGTGTPQTVNFSVDSTSNRLALGSYDSAGNLRSFAGDSYAYDVNNRLVSAGLLRFLYNAEGERVGVFADSSDEEMRFLVRSGAGQLLSELGFDPIRGVSRFHDYIWAGSRLVGRANGASNSPTDRVHYHLDQVGSVRVTTQNGFPLRFMDFLPYGERLEDTGEGHEDLFHFAGHERSHSTGLDAMHARFYSSEQARFLSVDPSGGDPAMPQSVNRYGYGMLNPLSYVDPDGRDAAKAGEYVLIDVTEGLRWAAETLAKPEPHPEIQQRLESIGRHSETLAVGEFFLAMVATGGVAAEAGMLRSVVGSAAVTLLSEKLSSGEISDLPDTVKDGALGGAPTDLVSSLISQLAAKGHTNVTQDGGIIVAVDSETGSVLAVDTETGVVFVVSEDAIEVTAQDPNSESRKGNTGQQKEGSKKPKWWESPTLTQERADWGIEQLRSGRCSIYPTSCLGVGGGGGFARGVQPRYY